MKYIFTWNRHPADEDIRPIPQSSGVGILAMKTLAGSQFHASI